MSDIPEWAVKRANDLTSEAMKDGSWLPIGGHASAAFARYIAEHEEPPVDPLLIEARELAAQERERSFRGERTPEEYRSGAADGTPVMRLALAALKRGMELAPRGKAMTNKATLLALAERVEGLDGPDRELDADIMRATGLAGLKADYAPHPYTASLDAAMTLVPEGDSFTVGQNVHHGHWVASVNYLDDDGAPQSRGCSNACRTGSLALCAAALRARAETQP